MPKLDNEIDIDAVAVVPADGTDLTNGVCKGLWVGGAGNVTVVFRGGRTATYTGVPAGTRLRGAFARVKATGTTATNMLALY